MDFNSREVTENKTLFNKSSTNDNKRLSNLVNSIPNMRSSSVFKSIASSVLESSRPRKFTNANKTESHKILSLVSKENDKFMTPKKLSNKEKIVNIVNFTPDNAKKQFNSNSTGRRRNMILPYLKNENRYDYEKNNFLSVNPLNLSQYFSFLSNFLEMDESNNRNTILIISQRFLKNFECYFIKFHNTISIFEENILNTIFQRIFKFSLIIVSLNVIFLNEFPESLAVKNGIKKFITNINELLCLFFELFVFHDKNIQSKEMKREFLEKVQKLANNNYNTVLNKSFKKNKINEITTVFTKLFENLQSQILFFVSDTNLLIFSKIIKDLIERIEDIKFSSFSNLVINNLLYCILSEKQNSRTLHDDFNKINEESPYLPPFSSDEKTLYTVVLDLDETLIHFFQSNSGEKFVVRPKAIEFLKEISQFCEIVIFTSATKEYADSVLNKIDPYFNYINYRLYRQHTRWEGELVYKDLEDLGRNLKKVVIIDNLEENYINHYNNGLHSLTWKDDIFDTQLNDFLSIISLFKDNKIDNIPLYIEKINGEIAKIRDPNKVENLYRKINLKSLL